MKILVVNAGSSSLKYQLIDMTSEKMIAKGNCERIGESGSLLEHSGGDDIFAPMPTHTEAVKVVLDTLLDKKIGVIKSLKEICAVGHRVVHSGETFTESVKITPKVIDQIAENNDMAPLHNPANILGIKACLAVMPKTPMVAVFDTAFHSTMPQKAYMYALPYEVYTQHKVRKYGFHGTSHMFVASEAAKLMGREDLKLVICHLGNGASISAVNAGKCIDTTMGLTPLQGLMMGTRSGDVDPAVVEYLGNKLNMNVSEVTNYLNKKSGMLGISGLNDFRDVCDAMDKGDERAKLAIDMFCYRVIKYIGAYAAAMNGIDCIAFTAGIGENTYRVRDFVLSGLSFLGVDFDREKNYKVRRVVAELTKPNSKVKAFIIPTNEELVIARETNRLVK
ncbi:MAG: acetate kinase [Firmicutes bacterium]|nr:acetate kinase [Bacillota bacterium]